MAEQGNKIYRLIVVGLLILNTFFLGSIWCSMKYYSGWKMGFCPWGAKAAGKYCPLTGKYLGEQKGAGMQDAK